MIFLPLWISRGFTLVELLIVVAVIAILVGLAVPNLLEAQTRAKVSRVKADLKTLETGLAVRHTGANQQQSAPVPADPFSGEPYKCSEGYKYYSIGPDKVDDEMSVLYDPTNGTRSAGDIWRQ